MSSAGEAALAVSGAAQSSPDVRTFTVGPVQENAHLIRRDPAARSAVLVDPGEEPERLLAELDALGVSLEAILVTHCHFDHIGALAPVAAATGAPVYCPELELRALADIMRWVPPGFGPFESYDADHSLAGGERLSLAGLDIEVLFTPGHSAGHLTYVISPAAAPLPGRASSPAATPRAALAQPGSSAAPTAPVLLSGDVLFRGSVGRVDLPGGNWAVLERSIEALLQSFPDETVLHPGHMQSTTLGHERDTNPFLTGLRVPDPPRQRSPLASSS